MTEFELLTSGVGSDRSANWATITYLPRAISKNKFEPRVTMLHWNNAIWLVKNSYLSGKSNKSNAILGY